VVVLGAMEVVAVGADVTGMVVVVLGATELVGASPGPAVQAPETEPTTTTSSDSNTLRTGRSGHPHRTPESAIGIGPDVKQPSVLGGTGGRYRG
jgi:hypothetical protein